MSRAYREAIEVRDYSHDRVDIIIETVENNWDVEEIHGAERVPGEELVFWGDETLCGGESEEEWATRISKEIIKANGSKPCTIHVHMTYLEELPYETYSIEPELDPQSFRKIVKEIDEEKENEQKSI